MKSILNKPKSLLSASVISLVGLTMAQATEIQTKSENLNIFFQNNGKNFIRLEKANLNNLPAIRFMECAASGDQASCQSIAVIEENAFDGMQTCEQVKRVGNYFYAGAGYALVGASATTPFWVKPGMSEAKAYHLEEARLKEAIQREKINIENIWKTKKMVGLSAAVKRLAAAEQAVPALWEAKRVILRQKVDKALESLAKAKAGKLKKVTAVFAERKLKSAQAALQKHLGSSPIPFRSILPHEASATVASLAAARAKNLKTEANIGGNTRPSVSLPKGTSWKVVKPNLRNFRPNLQGIAPSASSVLATVLGVSALEHFGIGPGSALDDNKTASQKLEIFSAELEQAEAQGYTIAKEQDYDTFVKNLKDSITDNSLACEVNQSDVEISNPSIPAETITLPSHQVKALTEGVI